MSSPKSLQKAINRAISYVSKSKRYNPACDIINSLISAINEYLKYVETKQSELEMQNYQLSINNNSERFEKILDLYNCDKDLNDEEIKLLKDLKQDTQFFVSNSAKMTLFKYRFVDIAIKKKIPNKKERPNNIEQLEKAYQILVDKYGNTKN